MITCSSCGEENTDSARFCGFCGGKMRKKVQANTMFGMLTAIPLAEAKEPEEAPFVSPQTIEENLPEMIPEAMAYSEDPGGIPTKALAAIDPNASYEPEANMAPIAAPGAVETSVDVPEPEPEFVPVAEIAPVEEPHELEPGMVPTEALAPISPSDPYEPEPGMMPTEALAPIQISNSQEEIDPRAPTASLNVSEFSPEAIKERMKHHSEELAKARGQVGEKPKSSFSQLKEQVREDKQDEQAFFGSSLSQYDMRGIDPSDFGILEEEEEKKSGGISIILVFFILLLMALIGGGAYLYFTDSFHLIGVDFKR